LNRLKDIRSTSFLYLEIDKDLKLHGNYQILKSKTLAVKYRFKEVTKRPSDALQVYEMILYSLGISRVMGHLTIQHYTTTFIARVMKCCEANDLPFAFALYKEERPEKCLKGSKKIKIFLTEYLLGEQGIYQKFSLNAYNIPNEYKIFLE
jgi:hypothetical protein